MNHSTEKYELKIHSMLGILQAPENISEVDNISVIMELIFWEEKQTRNKRKIIKYAKHMAC